MIDRSTLSTGFMALAAVAAVVGTAICPPLPRLVWNASASAPIGLYRAAPVAAVRVGDMVIARLPAPLEMLAAQRHYLPLGVPLVKRVVAVEGARACAQGTRVTLNGRPFVTRLAHDRAGRSLPAWQGCRTLARGETLLVMEHVRDSFDGRYFGPTVRTDLIAKVVPIWLR